MKAREHLLLWICMISGAAGCRSVPAESHTLTPQKVNASKLEFDGAPVSVRGFLVIEGEDRALFESAARFSDSKGMDACTSLLLTQSMVDQWRPLTGTFVMVSGVFRKNVMDDGVVRLGLCSITGLEVTEIVPSPSPKYVSLCDLSSETSSNVVARVRVVYSTDNMSYDYVSDDSCAAGSRMLMGEIKGNTDNGVRDLRAAIEETCAREENAGICGMKIRLDADAEVSRDEDGRRHFEIRHLNAFEIIEPN